MQNISLETTNQQSQLQLIKDAKYQISHFENQIPYKSNFGQISNDLKFIVLGGDQFLKIWKYKDNKLLKLVKLNCFPISCRFTNDSKYLYVGANEILYQLSIDSKFKIAWKSRFHSNYIINICCISEKMILTSSIDRTIVKTNVEKRQLLLKLYADNDDLYAIDYNANLELIASGSQYKSIKLWDGIYGTKIHEKKNAHNNYIKSLQFNLNNNQLLSLDYIDYNLKIWILDQTRQLQEHKVILCIGQNISFVYQQQVIISTSERMIKFYTFEGELIKYLIHNLNYISNNQIYIVDFNISQPDCMKSILMIGISNLYFYIRGCVCLQNVNKLSFYIKIHIMIIHFHILNLTFPYYFMIVTSIGESPEIFHLKEI